MKGGNVGRRRWAAVACVAMLAVGCGGASSGAAAGGSSGGGWSQVVSEAKSEGQVTWYDDTGNQSLATALGKEFTKKYGIQVQVLEDRPTALETRVNAEHAAKRNVGDVILTGDTTMLEMQQKGLFADPGGLPDSKSLKAPFKLLGKRVPVLTQDYGFLINTKLVNPSAFTCWSDLTKAQVNGKVIADDPSVLGAGGAIFAVTSKHFGTGYQTKLAAQNPVISRDTVQNAQRVGRGEFAVDTPFGLADTPVVSGMPAKVVSPCEGLIYATFEAAAMNNAPHPNAARLLVDYLLTQPAQQQFVNAYLGSVTGMPSKISGKLLDTYTADQIKKALPEAARIYHRG